MNSSNRTPADLLSSAFARDAARPLVTYYDDNTGERVELSATTLTNWVAKTANLLQDELGAEPGDRLSVLLPAHWQTTAWLLACHATGVVAEVGGDPGVADLVVSGPDVLDQARLCPGERVALSLRPLGARFAEPPEGFHDYADVVPGQPDTFSAWQPPEPDAPALMADGRTFTGAELLAEAAADAERRGLRAGDRLMSEQGYDTWAGLSAGLYAPLSVGGSVVLCHPAGALAEAERDRRVQTEQVTHFA